MIKLSINRRKLLTAGAATGLAGAFGLPVPTKQAMAQGTGMEYVFLSIVTQVPFWVDHRAALDDVAEVLGVRTQFTGPLDFDTAG